jgi:flavoprotein
MEGQMNLQQMTEEISNKLLETKSVLDIIEELTDEDAKMHVLLSQATRNIISSFEMIEKCRNLISKPL